MVWFTAMARTSTEGSVLCKGVSSTFYYESCLTCVYRIGYPHGMARTPRTVELTSISTRFPLETRRWLEQRLKETGRQSLNEVLNDLIEDARSWYRLPKPVVDVLERDRKQRKSPDIRDYLVNLLLERYVALQKAP